MKNALLVVLCCFMTVASLCSCVKITGSSEYMANAEKPRIEPIKDKATVVFIRPTGQAWMNKFEIWDNDNFIGFAQSLSYFRHVCDPGKHLFIAVAENKTFLSAELNEGRIYYIITDARMGLFKARVELKPVKKDSDEMKNVNEWMEELQFINPVDDKRKEWEERAKTDTRAMISYYNGLTQDQKAEYGALITADGI